MKIFGSNEIKQGIPKPKVNTESYDPKKYRYEKYIDPDCGCTKIRKVKIENDETNVSKQPK